MHELWRRMTNMLLEKEIVSCLPSPPDKRDWKFTNFMGVKALPPEFIRTSEMPPVRDQGKYGTCVGHAAWAQKSWQERQQGDEPGGGLSPLFIYSVCKTLDGIPRQAGTYPRTAMQVLQKYGVCSEKMMPYSLLTDDKSPPAPSQEAMTEAVKYRISNYAQICGYEDTAEYRSKATELIKRALFEQGPVLAALLVCENFMKPNNGIIPLPEGYILGGHAVTVVGYSDTRKAFLIMNSWGTSWGTNGFAWLPYEWVTYRIDDMWPAFFEAWTSLDLPYQVKRARHVVMRVGSNNAYVDGEVVQLDQPPTIVKGRALVPFRFVAENLGYKVNWQHETKTIEICAPQE